MRPPGSLFGDNPSGWAFGRTGQIHTGRANPFRALVAGLTADEFLLLREVVDKRRRREEVGVGTLAEAAAAYRPDPGCPECGARRVWRNGSTAAGVSRWRCRCCGRRFTSPTGTVLEHCRKPLPVWISFIRLMCRNVPVECAAELCGVPHKTAFDWRHRVLVTISGHLDRYVYLFRVNQARRMRFGCKGGAPYPNGLRGRRDLPQLGVGAASPII